ncbi:MAG: hypothetical protein RLZZ46_627, partial [Bacteroidota bacterium]
LECQAPFGGLGIKFVLSGEETYFIEGKKFIVKEGEYLLGNTRFNTEVAIKSDRGVSGICIDLSPNIVTQITALHFKQGKNLTEFLLSEKLLVNKYKTRQSEVVKSINLINREIVQGNIRQNIHEENLLFSLAEALIKEQAEVNQQMQRLGFRKQEAGKDVLRSLMSAKIYLEEYCQENISVSEICAQAGISKFHFIRLFKSVFGISPYQYSKKKKLEKAKNLLFEGNSVSEVAFLLNYPDLQSFSKAFKQQFGISPARLQKSNF